MKTERTNPQARDLPRESLMLTTEGLARALNCSPRSIRRLADQGSVPRPVKIGGLLRWPREAVERWIADGCPAVTTRRRGW